MRHGIDQLSTEFTVIGHRQRITGNPGGRVDLFAHGIVERQLWSQVTLKHRVLRVVVRGRDRQPRVAIRLVPMSDMRCVRNPLAYLEMTDMQLNVIRRRRDVVFGRLDSLHVRQESSDQVATHPIVQRADETSRRVACINQTKCQEQPVYVEDLLLYLIGHGGGEQMPVEQALPFTRVCGGPLLRHVPPLFHGRAAL